MSRLGVRVPRLPLKTVRPWCNWQHGWFQPSWSPVRVLGDVPCDGVDAVRQMALWPSGDGSSLTRRRSVVRVHPGLLAPKRNEASVHDVTAAYLLPMQIVWVRLPLHALWPSCVGPGLWL